MGSRFDSSFFIRSWLITTAEQVLYALKNDMMSETDISTNIFSKEVTNLWGIKTLTRG